MESTSYRKKILELSEKLSKDINKNELQSLRISFKNNAFNQHSNGEHDIYILQSLFGIVLINNTQHHNYSFTYMDFKNSFTYYPDFAYLNKMHKHNYFELLFVLDGQLDVYIEGVHYRYNRGDACLINPNVKHAESYHGNFKVIYFCISKEYLNSWPQEEVFLGKKNNVERFFQENISNVEEYKRNFIDFTPIIVPIQEATGVMEKLIYLIMKEMTEHLPGHKSIVRGLVQRFFSQLQNPSLYGYSYVQLETVSSQSLFERTLRYINEKKGKVTRQELADVLHYNGNYINQVFKKQTNQSISEYSRNVCLREASNLLLNSKLSITKIIKELGFENKTSFYTQFKKRYGVTPLEYRNGLYSPNKPIF